MIHHPDFPDECPSCGCTTYQGVEKMGSVVEMNDDGTVTQVTHNDPLNAWSSLFCADCGKMFIEDGVWVVDPETGDRPHECIDQDEYSTIDDWEDS